MPIAIRVSLKGDRKYRRAIRKLKRPERDPIDKRALRRMAIRLQTRTKGSYLSGQLLKRITGELFDSIVIDQSLLPRAIAVGSELVQAGVLHEGLRKGSRFKRRPFLERALDDVLPGFGRIWVEELERGIR